MRVQVLSDDAAGGDRPERGNRAATLRVNVLLDAVVDGLASVQRPSHWMLAFLLLLGLGGALVMWIGGGTGAPAVLQGGRRGESGVPQAMTGFQKTKSPLIGEGFVRLENGEPAKEAIVRVLGTDTVVRTDDTGRFRAPLPFAEVVLVASTGDGLVARGEPFRPGRDYGLMPAPDLKLAPGLAMRGIVRDSSGAPVAGTRVTIVTSAGRRESWSASGGTFECRGLLAESVRLEVLPPQGLAPLDREVVIVGNVDDVELVVQRAEALSVRVVDEVGTARPKVTLNVVDAEGRKARVTTGADGSAKLVGVSSQPFEFEAESPDGNALEIVRFESQDAKLVVR
jgi:hypothetical protein